MSATPNGSPSRVPPPPPGAVRPFHFPEIERFELSSGVRVLHARVPGIPVATLAVLVPGGAVAERPEEAGVASMTGGLLESGTARRSALDIAEELEQAGVQLSAGASWDAAQVEATAVVDRLEAAVDVVADLVCNAAFPEDEVERVRREHEAAIVQRRAEPRGLAGEMAARFIFAPDSPFGRPLGGMGATLAGMTRSTVTGFHAARYTPIGSTVVVAGDLSRDEVERMLERGLGGWAGPAAPTAPYRSEPRHDRRRVYLVDRPGSVQSELRVGRVGLPRNHPDVFPVVVANTAFGGAFTSRLNLNLRERNGFTYGASSSFAMRRMPGPFAISTAVQTEVTASALREIFHELDRLASEPLSETEVVAARSYVAGVFPLTLQTTAGVAARLAEIALYDLPLDYFDGYRREILAVEPAAANLAAARYLRPEEMVVVVVGDAERIRSEVEALDLGPLEVVAAAEIDG